MSAKRHKTQKETPHAGCHFGTKLIVPLFIPFRLDILSTWVELHADIPLRSRVH